MGFRGATLTPAEIGTVLQPSGGDDSAVLRAAAAALSSGGRLIFTGGEFLFAGSAIVLASGTSVIFDASASLRVTGPAPTGRIFHAEGVESATTNLDADATAGATTVTLPAGAGAGFTAGQLLALEADNLLFGALKPREIHKLISVAGDVLTLDSPLIDTYAVANGGRFSTVTPVTDLRFEGLRITADDPTVDTVHAIGINHGERITIDHGRVENAGGGLKLFECIDVTVAGWQVDRLPNYGDSFGYGIALAGACAQVTIDGLQGRGNRHLFTTLDNGAASGGPRHVTVNGAIGVGDPNSQAIFDTHEAGYDIAFNGCKAIGGGVEGFQIRARRVQLNSCTAEHNGTRAVTAQAGADDCRIEGGSFAASASNAISLAGANQAVVGARIFGAGGVGIVTALGATGPLVQGCHITDCDDSAIHDQGATDGQYLDNVMPQSAVQTTSILTLRASSFAARNIALGYGASSWGFTGADAAATLLDNIGDGTLAHAGRLVLHANLFATGAGAPTLGNQGPASTTRKVAWLLDAAGFEAVMGTFGIPLEWRTVDIYALWTNPAASVGDVRWRLYTQVFDDGDSTDASTAQADVDAAAPGQYVTERTALVAGLAVTGGELLGLWLQRRGGDAQDTLANDAALLAIEIRRAT